jgi:UDP-glucose 4-epimerase
MNVLITGGAGNLARYCAAELLDHGHRVTLFDRVRPEEAPSQWQTDTPFLVGDLTSREDCLRAVETAQAEAIVHIGGIPSPSEDPMVRQRHVALGLPLMPEDETFRVNVMGTFYIADAARRLGTKVIAFASTMARLNPRAEGVVKMPVTEEHPLWSENSYSLSKATNEETLIAFGRAYGVRAVAFRMLVIHYPHRDSSRSGGVTPGQPAVPPPPGAFVKYQYLDPRDAAVAYRLAIEVTHLNQFEAMILATDRTTLEPHRELIPRFYPHLRDQADNLGPDDIMLSIRHARERLGYTPIHSWRGPDANARVN